MADIAEEHPALKSDGHNVVLSGDANEPENGQKELDEANDEPVLEADEPLPSGFGHVSKDCSEEELQGWSQVLSQWKDNMAERPKLLSQLVRRGIPEALRGEVWQMLAKCYNDEELIAAYAILMTKDCRHDVYVARDVSRTFAVHPFFRGTNSAGQESLGRVCRAYAIFDEEIGYCQGMSFIVAALLLHMPEEQAFCVLVKIMQEYGLRNMFKVGFEELQLRFFQLEKLIGDHLPNLYIHFANNGIEAHMYASQWFLTMFSSKFPLYVVYSILDIYLLDGFPTMFQVALALLQLSEKDMLKQDFEGVMKYFRVYLPKKYRDVNDARLLLQTANRRSVTKQLKNYEAEYRQLSEQDKQRGDTVQRLQKENRRLLLSNMQLEQHLDDMARELIGSKIELRHQLDISEDKVDTLSKELLMSRTLTTELEEDKERLLDEVEQLKEVCRRELGRAEAEITRNAQIISDYKQITATMSGRLEKEEAKNKNLLSQMSSAFSNCDKCSAIVVSLTNGRATEQSKSKDNSDQGNTVEQRVRELELELAQTKLALVEAECQNQDVQHELSAAHSQLEASKNNWYQRTVRSIKETKESLVHRKDVAIMNKSLSFTRENSRGEQ